MLDIISVFKGAAKPAPIGEATWQDAIANIQSGKYQPAIDKVRAIKQSQGEQAYRDAKKNLPAVTFCANFSKNRDHKNVLSATGFLIPDLDHLENVEEVFRLLIQDPHIWFVFRSPSGSGLKCAVRAEGIKTDQDIKNFYSSVEYYFKSVYGLEIDSACKDIARLTFVSSDPNLFQNPNPVFFDIQKWQPATEERFYQPPDFGNNGWKSKYGLKVLENACQKIKDAPDGQRHPARLKQSKLIGGFIASGFIDELAAIPMIENALHAGGTKNIETAMKTVRDGIEFGKKNPIYPEDRKANESISEDIQYYCDVNEPIKLNERNERNEQHEANSAEMSRNEQAMSRNKQDNFSPISKKPQNLMAHISEWVTNSHGSFTTEQIDREFCLTSRTEKNARSQCLYTLINKKLIIRDRSIKGKYQIVNSDLNQVDIFNVDETPFKIKLPFMLHNYVSIPKKAIIIIAGTFNAGKTALILNILKQNLSQEYQRLYLMSEMGVGEYVDRLRQFDDVPFQDWQKIIAAERSFDFNGAIQHHNPDGLTCIDFLEEIEGKYYEMPSHIRNIYDALGTGVAIIAIQKKSDSDFARGGQATAEKARLYLAVDFLTVAEQSVICALKVIKVKRYIGGRNIQGHEIHFQIFEGSKIEPVSEWMKCSDVDRKRCIEVYQQPESYKKRASNYVFEFKTDAGRLRGVNEKNIGDWIKAFPNIDIMDALEDVANDSFKSGFLKDKSWYFQVAGILSKKNEKAAK